MKKVLLTAAIAMGSWVAQAQQLPLISNYLNTQYLFNPAFSGMNGATEITVLNRRQWTDVQGAPETQFMSFNGNLDNQKFGYSGYMFNDITSVVSRTGFYGNYAYHVNFTDENSLSFGLGAGYVNNNINVDAINVEDMTDPVLFAALDRGQFDLNFGLNLNFGDFHLGMGIPNLLAPAVDFSDNFATAFQYQYMRHFVVNTQYDVELQKGLMTLSPFVVVRTAAVTQPQVDAGLMFDHKEYFFVSAAYRSNYAVTANAGVHLTENVTMGYAYDFSLNTYGYALGNSHEFMLRYTFGESKQDKRLENEIKKLKDRQGRQMDDVEGILNDRFDEFKEEVSASQDKKIKEKLDKAINDLNAAANTGQNGDTDSNRGPVGTPSNGGRSGGNSGSSGSTQTSNGSGSGSSNTSSANTVNTGNIQGYDQGEYAGAVEPGSSGYYVTAGVFGSSSNAYRLRDKLKNSGINADVFQDPNNNMFYVFLMKFSTYNQAKQAQDSKLNGQYNGSLWIKSL